MPLTLQSTTRRPERARLSDLAALGDRVLAVTIRSGDSMRYGETLDTFARKCRDFRVISLRIAGKSASFRAQCETPLERRVSVRRLMRRRTCKQRPESGGTIRHRARVKAGWRAQCPFRFSANL